MSINSEFRHKTYQFAELVWLENKLIFRAHYYSTSVMEWENADLTETLKNLSMDGWIIVAFINVPVKPPTFMLQREVLDG